MVRGGGGVCLRGEAPRRDLDPHPPGQADLSQAVIARFIDQNAGAGEALHPDRFSRAEAAGRPGRRLRWGYGPQEAALLLVEVVTGLLPLAGLGRSGLFEDPGQLFLGPSQQLLDLGPLPLDDRPPLPAQSLSLLLGPGEGLIEPLLLAGQLGQGLAVLLGQVDHGSQQAGEPLPFIAQVISGLGDDRPVQADPLGDLKGAAHARLAVDQLVGGPPARLVEADREVESVRPPGGVGLDEADVGRSQDQRLLAGQFVQPGQTQGRPLGRVGAAAQLVDQNQPTRPGHGQGRLEPVEPGRVGGLAFAQVLFVADAGPHSLEDRQAAPLGHRDEQAGLGHQDQQAQGFEGHRLAAGVGSGDDQNFYPRSKGQVHRHCRPAAEEEERVAGLSQIQATALVQLWSDRILP